jgi:hypothetical protein
VTRRLPLLLAALALAAVVVALVGMPRSRTEVGVVTAIDAAGLTDVRSFTIRTADARTVTFRVGVLENRTEFPPGHLIEHEATSQPVRVWFHSEGDVLVATRIEDAP